MIENRGAATLAITQYDDAANRATEIDRRNTSKVTQKDALGRARTVTRDGVLLERNGYDGLGNKIDAEDVPRFVKQPADSTGSSGIGGVNLEEKEKESIRKALALCEGNREKAAKMLGIGERTLYRKIKRYGFN